MVVALEAVALEVVEPQVAMVNPKEDTGVTYLKALGEEVEVNLISIFSCSYKCKHIQSLHFGRET